MFDLWRKTTFYARYQVEALRRWGYEQITEYKYYRNVRYCILHDCPPVVYCGHNGHSWRIPGLLNRPSLVMCALFLSLEDAVGQARFRREAECYRANRHQSRLVFLTNTAAEADFVQSTGLEAVNINHNAFIDEQLFYCEPLTEKRYLAVYDAQLCPYKRHWLAAEIPDLALISYMYRPSPEMAYARHIRRYLSHARWINDPLTPGYRRLNPEEVRHVLNASRVGLCLSEVEGAMYASIQYLLCGLPVVSTQNIGGRDVYFHSDYTRTVPPDPKAIADAVRELAAANISAEEIRARTLTRVKADRNRFVALVQGFLDESGVQTDFSETFQKVFFNTLCRQERLKRKTFL